jgi:ABC-type spermidine/putrescine transport system permease subunit II
MLEPAMLLGLGAVSVWMHLRFPGLRPGSLRRAAMQVAVSFGAFALLPVMLGVALPLLSLHAVRLSVTLALLMASMTYLLLTWVWLIARVLHDLFGGTPRGGHPAATGT